MPFQKGQSGNPRGAVPKRRALTAILESVGNTAILVDADGKKHERKHLLAQFMWQAATEGTATLPNGTKMEFSPEDMLAAAKWIYTQVDGPPKAELELSGGLQMVVTADDLAAARKRAVEYEAATAQPPRTHPT